MPFHLVEDYIVCIKKLGIPYPADALEAGLRSMVATMGKLVGEAIREGETIEFNGVDTIRFIKTTRPHLPLNKFVEGMTLYHAPDSHISTLFRRVETEMMGLNTKIEVDETKLTPQIAQKVFDEQVLVEVPPYTGRAQKVEIPVKVFKGELKNVNTPAVLAYLKKHSARRGDVVHFSDAGDFRNNGSFMYDGKRVVPLYYEYDDYGSVAVGFEAIHEFPVDYWVDVIDHNFLIWFNTLPYVDQIRANLRQVEDSFYTSGFIDWNREVHTLVFPDSQRSRILRGDAALWTLSPEDGYPAALTADINPTKFKRGSKMFYVATDDEQAKMTQMPKVKYG